jgi:hypothetical protein
MARAKAAGLGSKDNWKSYPRQMLRARVISEGVRATFPAVLNGMYTPEEVGEFDSLRPTRLVKVEVTPEPVAEAPKVIEVEAVAVSNDTTPEPDWAAELEKRIFEYEAKVNAFLIAKGQITEGQTFRDMTDADYIARVMGNTEKFLAAVVAATQPANEAVEQKEAA